jgi:hypothetical protein
VLQELLWDHDGRTTDELLQMLEARLRGSRLLAMFLALSVLLNIVIVYRVLDRGVTLTHREDEFLRLQEKA